MLSRNERLFLMGELNCGKDYEYFLTHSLRKKIRVLETELPLLLRNERTGAALENILSLSEIPKMAVNENKAETGAKSESWRTRRDLNPGSPAPQAGALILAQKRLARQRVQSDLHAPQLLSLASKKQQAQPAKKPTSPNPTYK